LICAELPAVWTVFNTTFLVGSLPTNLVYIVIFGGVEVGFALISASYFLLADGHADRSVAIKKAGGAFCFLAGMFGWHVKVQMWRHNPVANKFKVSRLSSHHERLNYGIAPWRHLKILRKEEKDSERLRKRTKSSC
jgi:hypothetical protein